MKYPVIKFVFNRRKTATKKKVGSVDIEITWEGKRKFKSTGVRVYKDEWNDKAMVIGRDDQQDLNDQLNNLASGLRKIYMALAERKKLISWREIDEYLDGSHTTRHDNFLEWMREMVDKRPVANETKRQHYSKINNLEKFGKIVYFDDLTPENIRAYDTWLHNMGKTQPTIWNDHKVVKIYINEAVQLKLIDENPYDGFKVSKGKSADIKYLEYDDVLRIQNLNLEGTIDNARDLFIVQCYTGMAYKDLMAFNWDDVQKRGDKYVVRNRRLKTQEQYFFVLLKPVIDILEKRNHVLPKLSNVQYNGALAVIRDMLGVKIKITSHVARHSFGVMMINNGIPIDVVAKAMGHSSSKTTEIYAKILGKSVEDAFEQLGKKLGV